MNMLHFSQDERHPGASRIYGLRPVWIKVTVFPVQGRLLFHCRNNNQSNCGEEGEKRQNFHRAHGEPPPPAFIPDWAAHRSPLGQPVARLTAIQ